MVDIKTIGFGCADAETEASRNPALFKSVFFDPHNYLNELVYGNKFILRGRKGDGKTAYSAQIKLLSENENYYAYQRSLNNFNNTVFAQIKTFDRLGGNPYIPFWKCILLIEAVAMLEQYEPNIAAEDYAELVYALKKYGFLSKDDDITYTISKLVETDSSININSFFSHNRKHQHTMELNGAEQIYLCIRNTIKNLSFHSRFIFIVDGLDDILFHTEFKPEIITGLIRAVDDINRFFSKQTLELKLILLVRNDMLDLCRDSNLSKMIRDSSINLNWRIQDNALDSELIHLLEKRIDIVTGSVNSFPLFFKYYFPDKINDKDCLDYILDNIIYRPRDLLQLFLEFQAVASSGRKLTVDKIKNALWSFSEEYFVDAMKDELTGFFPNEAVTILPTILTKMGTRYFYLEDFEKECSAYPEFNNISKEAILKKLFDAGYIGQHRPREGMDYTVFSYRNLKETFNSSHECIIHRGLTRALTI